MPLITGQASGDFLETYSRIHLFQQGGNRCGALSILSPDGFTQTNPTIVKATNTRSATLAGITKRGILGSSIIFTRPDIGNGVIGGPVLVGSAYQAYLKPLGFVIDDANGQRFENTPGIASGKTSYYNSGSFGVRLWETQVQITQGGGTAGDPLTYSAGDILYASVNGFVTNRYQDGYQYNVAGQNDIGFVTPLGIITQAPSSVNDLLVFDTSS